MLQVVPWLPMPLTVRDLFFAIPAVFIAISFATCVLRCEGVIAQRPASERLEVSATILLIITHTPVEKKLQPRRHCDHVVGIAVKESTARPLFRTCKEQN